MESRGTHKLQPKEVNQVGILVKDVDKVAESWSQLFGMGPWRFVDVDHSAELGKLYKLRLALTYIGPLNIELIQHVEGETWQAEYLDKVGEGLHHINFRVDDMDKEVSNLVAQGAEVFYTVPGRFAYLNTGGPGGAVFEIVQRRSGTPQMEKAESQETPDFQPKEVNQIGILVKDVDKVVESWSQLFGMGPWRVADVDHTAELGKLYKLRIAHALIGPLDIELIQPVAGDTWQAEYIEKVGEGLHHLNFRVDDMDKVVSHLVARRAKVFYTVPGRFAYLETGGPGDVVFEIVQKRN